MDSCSIPSYAVNQALFRAASVGVNIRRCAQGIFIHSEGEENFIRRRLSQSSWCDENKCKYLSLSLSLSLTLSLLSIFCSLVEEKWRGANFLLVPSHSFRFLPITSLKFFHLGAGLWKSYYNLYVASVTDLLRALKRRITALLLVTSSKSLGARAFRCYFVVSDFETSPGDVTFLYFICSFAKSRHGTFLFM